MDHDANIVSVYHSVNLSKFILSRWVEHDPMEISGVPKLNAGRSAAKADRLRSDCRYRYHQPT